MVFKEAKQNEKPVLFLDRIPDAGRNLVVHITLRLRLRRNPFATNNMLFGAIVVILAVGTIFYEIYHKERFERETVGGMERVKERV